MLYFRETSRTSCQWSICFLAQLSQRESSTSQDHVSLLKLTCDTDPTFVLFFSSFRLFIVIWSRQTSCTLILQEILLPFESVTLVSPNKFELVMVFSWLHAILQLMSHLKYSRGKDTIRHVIFGLLECCSTLCLLGKIILRIICVIHYSFLTIHDLRKIRRRRHPWTVWWPYFSSFRYAPYPTRASDSPNDILRSIAESTVDVSSGCWSRVSPTAKNLVEKMLHVDPKQRYRAIDVLRHPFLTERLSLPTRILHHERDSRQVKEDVGRIFEALNAPPSLNLNPVVQSSLAKRRANRSSSSKTMITVWK